MLTKMAMTCRVCASVIYLFIYLFIYFVIYLLIVLFCYLFIDYHYSFLQDFTYGMVQTKRVNEEVALKEMISQTD